MRALPALACLALLAPFAMATTYVYEDPVGEQRPMGAPGFAKEFGAPVSCADPSTDQRELRFSRVDGYLRLEILMLGALLAPQFTCNGAPQPWNYREYNFRIYSNVTFYFLDFIEATPEEGCLVAHNYWAEDPCWARVIPTLDGYWVQIPLVGDIEPDPGASSHYDLRYQIGFEAVTMTALQLPAPPDAITPPLTGVADWSGAIVPSEMD